MKRATRLFPIAILVAVFAGAQVPPGQQLDEQIAALQAQVVSLQSQIDALPTQADIDALQAQLDSIAAQVVALQDEQAAQRTELDDHDGRIASAEAALAGLQSAFTALEARVTALETTAADHEARLVALEGSEPPPPPPDPVCGDGTINQTTEQCDGADLGGETCASQGFDGGTLSCTSTCLFDTSQCSATTGTGALADGVWVSVPGSEMRSIYDPAIDDQWDAFGAPNSFEAIQTAWSGATCVGDELVLMGGGHGDGAHNGVFAVDVSDLGLGTWRRVTSPSVIWNKDTEHPTIPINCPPASNESDCTAMGGIWDGTACSVHHCIPPLGEPCRANRCNALPDGRPTARHTYDALSSDGVDFYALGGAVWGSGTAGEQPRSWKLDMSTATWSPLPDIETRSTGLSAFAQGKIYYAARSRRGRVYDVVANSWETGALQTAVGHDTIMVYVPTMDRLFALGDNHAWSVPRTDFLGGATTSYAIPSGSMFETNDAGITYYPLEDLILGWNGGQVIETLDPHTGEFGSIALGGEDPGIVNGSGVYSRFNYCGDRLVLVNGVDNPLYHISVPEDVVDGPEPPPEPEPTNNFLERATAPGVVFVDPLDTQSPWWVDENGEQQVLVNADGTVGIPTHSWWRELRGVSCAASTGCVDKPQLDATTKASGTGSLKFTYRDGSRAGGGGVFATNISGDLSLGFGEGETLHVQYRIRHSCDALYFDCNPKSPTYKTQRRFFRTSNNGTTAMKNLIIADGDPSFGESSDACTWMQVVVNHGEDHSLQGFHSCGWYAGFSEKTGENFFGSNQFDTQAGGYALDSDGNKILGLNDTVFPTCWWMPDVPDSGEKDAWGFTGPDCWGFEAEEWATIQVRVEIGTWQPDREGPPNSRVTIWAAHEGESQTRIVDHALYLRGPNFKFNTSGDYGKIWLLPHMTKKDETETHPTFFIWYDELIVSKEFIGDPS